MGPVSRTGLELRSFVVEEGTGFREIATKLEEEGLIKSSLSFTFYVLATGAATDLKAGEYQLNSAMSIPEIAETLRAGDNREVAVRIPEGASIYVVDRVLAEAGILGKGTFSLYAKTQSIPVEGYLFPDTYRLYRDSTPGEVMRKMQENFDRRAKDLLDQAGNRTEAIIIASLLEKEVPDYKDRQIVAGILRKRLAQGMNLQVDSTICYMKQQQAGEYVTCEPITQDDLRTKNPYNTYVNAGLPPGPIGSPGLEALRAALNPIASEYWFYLSDPKTKKTIFSRTLDEHARNRVKYLLNTE